MIPEKRTAVLRPPAAAFREGGTVAGTGPPLTSASAAAASSSGAIKKKSWLATTTAVPDPIEKVIGWQQAAAGGSEKLIDWQPKVGGGGGGDKLIGWQQPMAGGSEPNIRGAFPAALLRNGRGGVASSLFRGRTPSYEALKGAVTDLYRLDDFVMETLGAGFFSDVYKVTHKTTGRVLVLKMNKHKSNRNNMLKEIQLMNKLKHPHILRFEAVCVHEGQLHALTEYIAGGNLEQLIQDKETELPWSVRIELSLHIAKGLLYLNSQGFFHRDLTSKNILVKKEEEGGRLTAIVGDFGLATRIPSKSSPRLPQVGSPYWMSPECLRGEHYDHTADIFSFGIILCELIARCDADPDVLPRTQNFGVDYLAFSELCPACPPDFLKLAFTCVSIDPPTRPKSNELVSQLKVLFESQCYAESPTAGMQQQRGSPMAAATMGAAATRRPGLTIRRYLSEGEMSQKKSPSEKARLHQLSASFVTARSVGEEMCLLDPYYKPRPRNSICSNPFATLPRLREGRKIIGSTCDLFSSCFELPSPRVSSPTDSAPTAQSNGARSLPASPVNGHKSMAATLAASLSLDKTGGQDSSPHSLQLTSPRSAELQDLRLPGRRRVETLRSFYTNRANISQDDSVVGICSGLSPAPPLPLRRCGSCESGFCSVSDDWFLDSGPLSARSLGSSLLTVSDLEEDLRAASAFLSNKRTSSVFTDSLDDLSSRLDDISNIGVGPGQERSSELGDRAGGYEKDIRDIVEYFERSCHARDKLHPFHRSLDMRTSPEIARSQKIESLIKRVVENKTRARLSRKQLPHQNHLQVCEGIVRSKLPLFDTAKRPVRPRLPANQKGFVQARRAMFDAVPPAAASAAVQSTSTACRAGGGGGVVDEPAASLAGLADPAGRAGKEKPSRQHVAEMLRQRELRCLAAATTMLTEPSSCSSSSTKKAD